MLKKKYFQLVIHSKDRRSILNSVRTIIYDLSGLIVDISDGRCECNNYITTMIVFLDIYEGYERLIKNLDSLENIEKYYLTAPEFLGVPTRLTVQLHEVDPTTNVYNGAYYNWFDMGRIDLLSSFGIPYTEFLNKDLYSVITESHCRYKKPINFHDHITVYTRLVGVSKISADFKYHVTKDNDSTVCAEGYTRHIYINQAKKIIPIPGPVQAFYCHEE